MPTFSLDSATHPFLQDEICFAIDVLGADSTLPPVQAYVGHFRRSIVASVLAERLNLVRDRNGYRGDIILETRFEGDLVIHRSRPIPFEFKEANEKAGDAYIHFATDDLQHAFEVQELSDRGHFRNDRPFLVLTPFDVPAEFCEIIPLERPSRS